MKLGTGPGGTAESGGESWKEPLAILFDIDGTLISTGGGGAKSWRCRLPTEVETSVGYRVLDGVEELLPRLCRSGFLLGITTGTIEAAAQIKLARGDLNRFFCFGGYGSDSDDRAGLTGVAIQRAGRILGRSLDPRLVVVVGDTPLDIEATRAVGAISVGVATGHYSEGELKEAGAEHVLASLRDPLPFPNEWERAQSGL